MNTELALLKFIKYYIKHNPDENGQNYNADQANLVETFGYSLVEKVLPKTFEDNIVENKMKLKSKRIKDDYVRIPLTPIQILHFKLLYNIAYLNRLYPDKINDLNLSEDLSELLDDENKILNLYNEIKKIGLN
ncbi:hypothetical protein [Candidatus Pelagibacter sp. HIMB1611]|uniref:hypothetical protein n=1 Tax=Candidatus Pelagibacter sp. HIMB1611 TaxID=3413357 RepID=UPI003F84A3E1